MFLISLRAGGVQEILRHSGMELKRFDFLIEPPVIHNLISHSTKGLAIQTLPDYQHTQCLKQTSFYTLLLQTCPVHTNEILPCLQFVPCQSPEPFLHMNSPIYKGTFMVWKF